MGTVWQTAAVVSFLFLLNDVQKAESSWPRVRARNEASGALLKDGLRRSATVSALAAELETFDLLVFVSGSRDPGNWRGRTTLRSSGSSIRVFAVDINMVLLRNEQVAVLGHELQHVKEVAAAPEVTSQDAMQRFFKRVGIRVGWDQYETQAAQNIEHRVRQEILGIR
jgi:hypothetical protein